MALSTTRGKNLRWSLHHDETFIKFLVKQVKAGKTIPGGFTAEAWREVTRDMIGVFGVAFARDKLKNRFKTLKKTYKMMKAMIQLGGLGWDVKRKIVIAEPEVWEEYIKAHPVASNYRSKQLPNYNGLALIFGDCVAEGRDDMDSSPPPTAEDLVDGFRDNMGGAGDGDGESYDSGTNASTSRPIEPMTRVSLHGQMNNAEMVLASALETVARAIAEVAKNQVPARPSMRQCIDALCPLNLEGEAKFRAITILEDPVKATTFMALDVDDRAGWMHYELSSLKG